MKRLVPLLALSLLLGMACTSPNMTDEEAGTTSVPVTAPPSSSSREIWLPTSSLTWQWQLTELPIDTSLNVDVYDLDLFDTDASVVSTLHAQ